MVTTGGLPPNIKPIVAVFHLFLLSYLNTDAGDY